jgi:hypothetical protein
MKYFRPEPEETFTGLMEQEFYSASALGRHLRQEEIAAHDQPWAGRGIHVSEKQRG